MFLVKPIPTRLCLLSLAALVAAPVHAQSVSDFSLEPAPTATPTTQAQGPADTRAGVQIAPRAVNTPTPTPVPSPIPTPVPSPLPVTPPSSAPATRVTPTPSAAPAPRITSSATERRTTFESAAAVDEPAPVLPTGVPEQASPVAAAPTRASAAPASDPVIEDGEAEDGDGTPWLPILLGALVLLLGSAVFLVWRRRRVVAVPEIERPVVGAGSQAAALPLAESLTLRIDHEKLIRSAAFATLKYRMVLTNRTATPLTQLAIGLDMVSAHSAVPVEEQLATPATAFEKRHEVARLGPHQSVTVEGQVQLPLAQAHVIQQGRHPLLVPLLRVRIDGSGEDALIKTFVVGQGAPGGARLQPFRLDEGPRSYAPIAQRELA